MEAVALDTREAPRDPTADAVAHWRRLRERAATLNGAAVASTPRWTDLLAEINSVRERIARAEKYVEPRRPRVARSEYVDGPQPEPTKSGPELALNDLQAVLERLVAERAALGAERAKAQARYAAARQLTDALEAELRTRGLLDERTH
jgi:hypothetical protein